MKACRSRVTRSRSVSTMPCEASGYSISFDWAMPSDVAFPIANGPEYRPCRAAPGSGTFTAASSGGNRFWRRHRRKPPSRRHWPASPRKRRIDHFLRHRIGRRPLGVEEHVPEQAGEIGLAIALHARLMPSNTAPSIPTGLFSSSADNAWLRSIRRLSRRCGRYAAIE